MFSWSDRTTNDPSSDQNHGHGLSSAIVSAVESMNGDRSASHRMGSHADQVQIALAIADERTLSNLLIHCTPPISQPHRIGLISSTVGIRVDAAITVDGVIDFEDIICIPAGTNAIVKEPPGQPGYSAAAHDREIARMTCCQSELKTLMHHASLAQVLSVLAQVGFSSRQIQDVLHLPNDAWHKSWWFALDAWGNFDIPFYRLIRTRRYTDGTLTIQYKDYFEHEQPPCFKSRNQRVLVAIQLPNQSFSEALSKINYGRQILGIDQAILICDRLSELEARGFVSQNISLYAASDLVLPTRADCLICANHDCPMNHQANSPVTTCRNFCVGEWSD